MDRSSTQKLNKEKQSLNDPDLTVIYRAFHLKAAEYTFFVFTHGNFFRIDHVMSQKASLSEFKKNKILSSIISEHNAMRLVINYRKEKL